MAWHRGTPPPPSVYVPPPSEAGEKCDRCDWPGQVRVIKTTSELCDRNGEPHVFGVLIELVFCTNHYRAYEAALRQSGWSQAGAGGVR
jgi:hypothetical protein